jgi:hypothetical protein
MTVSGAAIELSALPLVELRKIDEPLAATAVPNAEATAGETVMAPYVPAGTLETPYVNAELLTGAIVTPPTVSLSEPLVSFMG